MLVTSPSAVSAWIVVARSPAAKPVASAGATSGVMAPRFTAPTGARSVAACTVTSTAMPARLSLTSWISSVNPSTVAWRLRSTRTVGSAIGSPTVVTAPTKAAAPPSSSR